jgi:hypothetical protein
LKRRQMFGWIVILDWMIALLLFWRLDIRSWNCLEFRLRLGIVRYKIQPEMQQMFCIRLEDQILQCIWEQGRRLVKGRNWQRVCMEKKGWVEWNLYHQMLIRLRRIHLMKWEKILWELMGLLFG